MVFNFRSLDISEDEPDSKLARAILERVDGPVYYQADTEKYLNKDTTLDIVEKIKAINNGLTKPKREQINLNLPYAEKSQGIDQELLKKLQDIIASGKIKSNSLNLPEDNKISSDDHQVINSRALKFNPEMLMGNGIQMMPFPYIINLPVVVAPNSDLLNKIAVNNNFKSVLPNDAYTTRQQSSFLGLPFLQNFNFEWPLTQSLFPLLIKNPFIAFSQGGGWENFIEYGQSADVCNRKQKSGHSRHLSDELDFDQELNDSDGIMDTSLEPKINARKSRALKKRTIADKSPSQDIEESNSGKKIYVTNQTPTRRTTKKPNNVERIQDSKNDDSGGDLRFPFGDFNWFGDKKPAVPLPPGFFINRLRVRKGGVAIAGPGGVATAGRGGTAIVGPGGLAYTQPGGLAVAGPHARIVALPETTDINDVLSSLQENDSSVPAASQPIREGKLVATGPVIYYHPTEQPSQS